MKELSKNINIALISMLMGIFLCQNTAFCAAGRGFTLRAPSHFSKSTEAFVKTRHKKENNNSTSGPRIVIEKFVKISIAGNIVIVNVIVGNQRYEISGIGVKKRTAKSTTEIIKDPQECIKIANLVNEVDGRLGEAAKEEKWGWWTPQPGQTIDSNQTIGELSGNLEVIKNEEMKIIIEAMKHEFRSYFSESYAIFERLKEFFGNSAITENIINQTDNIMAKWEDLCDSLHKITDSEEIIIHIKDNADIIKEMAMSNARINELLLQGEFEEKKAARITELNNKILKKVEEALNFIKAYSSLKEDNINNLIELFNNRKSGWNVMLNLSQEPLKLDKTFSKEEFMIISFIRNFIYNADRNSIPGQPIEITIKTSNEKEKIKIEVSDTGKGIPEDFLRNKLFERGATTKKSGEGEGGEGLWITLQYLKMLKKIGKDAGIQVDSKEDGKDALRLTFTGDKLDKKEISGSDRQETGTTFTMWLPIADLSQPEKEFLYRSGLASIALKEFHEKNLYTIKRGGTTVYFDADQHWDFVVKEANKPAEFKNREKLYPIAPDAFIPWLTLDKEKKLWVEERTDPISVFLDDCKHNLFYMDKKEEAELKIKELADIWADKYLYLIQRGIKCLHEDTIKMDDFGKSQVTGEWGFFDFGALIKAETPSSENEVRFAKELGRSLFVFEMELKAKYPKEFAEWWKTADKYSKLAKKLYFFKQEWKEIWNIKPPENKFPQFRSKYLESLTLRQAEPSKPAETIASGETVIKGEFISGLEEIRSEGPQAIEAGKGMLSGIFNRINFCFRKNL
jgi:signal transduction histidine kinase